MSQQITVYLGCAYADLKYADNAILDPKSTPKDAAQALAYSINSALAAIENLDERLDNLDRRPQSPGNGLCIEEAGIHYEMRCLHCGLLFIRWLAGNVRIELDDLVKHAILDHTKNCKEKKT